MFLRFVCSPSILNAKSLVTLPSPLRTMNSSRIQQVEYEQDVLLLGLFISILCFQSILASPRTSIPSVLHLSIVHQSTSQSFPPSSVPSSLSPSVLTGRITLPSDFYASAPASCCCKRGCFRRIFGRRDGRRGHGRFQAPRPHHHPTSHVLVLLIVPACVFPDSDQSQPLFFRLSPC